MHTNIVHDEGSEAMQWDLCNEWAHIACVGITKAYKLAGRLKGFQWLCPNAWKSAWRSTKHQVLDLASELKSLHSSSRIHRSRDGAKQPQKNAALSEIPLHLE